MSFSGTNSNWTHYPDSEKTCRNQDNCPLFVPVERHVFSEQHWTQWNDMSSRILIPRRHVVPLGQTGSIIWWNDMSFHWNRIIGHIILIPRNDMSSLGIRIMCPLFDPSGTTCLLGIRIMCPISEKTCRSHWTNRIMCPILFVPEERHVFSESALSNYLFVPVERHVFRNQDCVQCCLSQKTCLLGIRIMCPISVCPRTTCLPRNQDNVSIV